MAVRAFRKQCYLIFRRFENSRNARVRVSLLHGGRLERLGTGLKIYFELLDFEPPQGLARSACPERTKRVEG
jgi:hypothetical protein